MRISRFFASGRDREVLLRLSNNNVQAGAKLELFEPELIHQLRSVLRLGSNDKFILMDGTGAIYHLSIEALEKSKLNCRIDRVQSSPLVASTVVSVGMALIKTDRFEWCIEKLTELGAGEIVPIQTRHCVAKLPHDAKGAELHRIASRLSRWQAIAKEAAEQCERSTIPPVVNPMQFNEFLKRPASGAQNYDLKFICAERLPTAPLVKALAERISIGDLSLMNRIGLVSLLIGPEGGFNSDEFAASQAHGYVPVSLGPRILRSETAAIVAMSQVASVLDI